MSLFPFTTSWVGEHLLSGAPELTYGIVVLGSNLSYLLLVRVLSNVTPEHEHIKKAHWGSKKMYLSVSINVLGLLLGVILHPLAVLISNVIVLIFWVVPERSLEKRFEL